jgi:site-specific DNA recombinase
VLDAEIRRAFLRSHYNLKIHGEAILTEMLNSLQAIRNRRMLWSLDVIELNKQISELTSQNQMLATLKQQGLIDPDIFISQNNELTEQLRTAKLKKERLLVADGDSTIAQTRELMEILDAGPDFLDDFDAELFGELVEKIIVDSSEQLRFRLKNGLELVEIIERTVR